MAETTGIEWADATWNPWYGCRKVSPACAHCYAEREMTRFGRDFAKVKRAANSTFYAPVHWRTPRKIFTCSWSDFFIEDADAWRDEAFNVIDSTHHHTYQILTKRPERIMAALTSGWCPPRTQWPIHAWVGVSVENSRFYARVEHLQRVPARVRFLSIEPLLGPMPDLPLDGIHWVIVGGESGSDFRPLNLDWVRQIRDRCIEKGVAFFFKQKSALLPKKLDRLLDGKEWNEFPGNRNG